MIRNILRMICLVAVPVIAMAQPENTNISYEMLWNDTHHTWYDKLDPVFYNYQGSVYVFNRQTSSGSQVNTYLYKFDKDRNYGSLSPYYIGDEHENVIYHWPDANTTIEAHYAFQFDNRLWYSKANYYNDQSQDQYIDVFFQLPLDTNSNCYWTKEVHGKDYQKLAAFQIDSNLFFLCVKYGSGLSTTDSWNVQQYHYTPNVTYAFKFDKLTDLPGIKGTCLGGIARKIDSLGNSYFLVNTFTPNGSSFLGKLAAIKNAGGITFEYTQYEVVFNSIASSTLLEGSIGGGKTSDPNPQQPDRINVFAIDQDQQSNGAHLVRYTEYYLQNGIPASVNTGIVNINSSDAPQKINNTYRITGSYELLPLDLTTSMDGIDGMQQKCWIYYAVGSKHFKGERFNSDRWRLDTCEIVTSADLNDTVQYQGVKSLWTLTGIVEGAPPVSVNWELWEKCHPLNTPTSSLTIHSEASTLTDITTSFDDTWSASYGADFGSKIIVSLKDEFKYSETYRTTIKSGVTIKKSVEQQFELYESSQPYGFYIWTIPLIRRYAFRTYPWWDTLQMHYPVPNSTEYLFRIIGISTHNEPIPLNRFPFQVTNPENMSSWTESGRPALAQNLGTRSPVIDVAWTSGSPGGSVSMQQSSSSSHTYENGTSYNRTVSAGISVPFVFSRNASYSTNVKYSTETTIKTEFGQSISASLSNLLTDKEGPNTSKLAVNVYWLTPEMNANWWYYDSLNGAKPWYLPYLVINFKGTLNLLSPKNGSIIKEQELLFSWQAEGDELNDYTFFIATSPVIEPGSILYQRDVTDLSDISVPGFKPEKGTTYYWAVRGRTKNLEAVWSRSWSFSIDQNETGNELSDLKIQAYPNPEKLSKIKFLVQSDQEGNIKVRLYNIRGDMVAQREVSSNGLSAVTFTFEGITLPAGVYYAVFTTADGVCSKKILIN